MLPPPKFTNRRPALIRAKHISLALLALVLIVFVTSAAIWPFRKQRLLRSLASLSVCDVNAQTFQPVFFPEPGYLATGLTFVRRENGRPIVLATVRQLRGRISWFSLLTLDHRIRHLQADGLHIFIPPHVPPPPNYPPDERMQAAVTHLDAPAAQLDVAPRLGIPQLHVSLSRLAVENIGKNQAMSLSAQLHNNFPEADLLLTGRFGPFLWSDMKRTPLALRVQLNRLNLNRFQSVRGTAAGEAAMTGPFDRLRVSGHIRVPDFHATNSLTFAPLSLQTSAIVNAATGNAWILDATAQFLQSMAEARGSIVYGLDHRRKVELSLASTHSRIEDLLSLFLNRQPPLSGAMTFQGNAAFLTGPQSFLNRLRLTGNFHVAPTRFRNPQLQRKLDETSDRIRKIKFSKRAPALPVPSALAGSLTAANGRAVLSGLQLHSPGLAFDGAGVVNLSDPTIDLRGTLQTQSTLSRAVGGFKGFVALPLDPFFRTSHGRSAIPVRITGPFDNPSFKMSLHK